MQPSPTYFIRMGAATSRPPAHPPPCWPPRPRPRPRSRSRHRSRPRGPAHRPN